MAKQETFKAITFYAGSRLEGAIVATCEALKLSFEHRGRGLEPKFSYSDNGIVGPGIPLDDATGYFYKPDKKDSFEAVLAYELEGECSRVTLRLADHHPNHEHIALWERLVASVKENLGACS